MMEATIIGDIGINHDGDLSRAKWLADRVKQAGAIAKFQMFWCFPDLGKYEFSSDQWDELFRHCDDNDILFFVTAFDRKAIDYMVDRGQHTWKVPSGMLTNNAYLNYLMSHIGHKLVIRILSTGMAMFDEIDRAVEKFKPDVLMHCVSAYPTPYKEVNLNAILTMRDRYKIEVGYSDHTSNSNTCAYARVMGAMYLEAHITHDWEAEGPDHRSSLDPGAFASMVSQVRDVERLLGDGKKRPSRSESVHRKAIRKRMQTI